MESRKRLSHVEERGPRPRGEAVSPFAGGLSLNFTTILAFRVWGSGWNGCGVLLDPTMQSPELVSVWTELEPLPKVYADPVPVIVGLFGFGFVHAVGY